MIKEINPKEIRQKLVLSNKLEDFKKWQVIYLSTSFNVDNQFISLITGLDLKTIAQIMLKFRKTISEKSIPKSSKTLKNVSLNEREVYLIRLICSGKSSIQIGEEMGLAARTVEGLRMELYKKLDISKVTDLVILAVKGKII